MAFDFSTLITDRSPEDLQALRDLLATPMADWTAEQLAEFKLAKSKGAYNYTDLNRVTACMDYLNERLTGLGYETGYQRIEVPHQEPEPVGPLPEGYTLLAYIASTGTQWINSGFIPNQNTRIIVDCKADSVSPNGSFPFGVRSNYIQNAFCAALTPTQVFYNFATSYQFVSASFSDQKLKIDANRNVCTFTAGELSETVSLTESNFTAPSSIILFSTTEQGSVITGEAAWHGAIYNCKIYDDNVLVRDFLPCINPDGDSGLFDIINQGFYGNSGTGAFVAGPAVVLPEPEPTLDPYTWYESDTPTQAQMTQYLANVEALKEALTLADNAPELPSDMDGLTTQEANHIEEIFAMINLYLLALQRVFLRSGMAWAVSGGPEFYFAN